MNCAKISAHLTSALFPAAGLYLCGCLLDAAGELVADMAFAILTVNYFWIMRNIKKLENKIWFA